MRRQERRAHYAQMRAKPRLWGDNKDGRGDGCRPQYGGSTAMQRYQHIRTAPYIVLSALVDVLAFMPLRGWGAKGVATVLGEEISRAEPAATQDEAAQGRTLVLLPGLTSERRD